MEKRQTYHSKKWSRKGQCPVCKVSTDSYHSVYCNWYVTTKAAQDLGKIGGEATKSKLGNEHFKRISKLGVEARKK